MEFWYLKIFPCGGKRASKTFEKPKLESNRCYKTPFGVMSVLVQLR